MNSLRPPYRHAVPALLALLLAAPPAPARAQEEASTLTDASESKPARTQAARSRERKARSEYDAQVAERDQYLMLLDRRALKRVLSGVPGVDPSVLAAPAARPVAAAKPRPASKRPPVKNYAALADLSEPTAAGVPVAVAAPVELAAAVPVPAPAPMAASLPVPMSAPVPVVAPAAPAAPVNALVAAAAVAAATATSPPVLRPAGSDNRFDLAVNNAPAAQVFMQLGSGTDYNMLVGPDVAGNISITLRNTTVPEALESLRELFGYDYRISGNRVFVYPNTVQTRMYRVNYLPGRREGASDTRVTSSAISQSGAGGTSGAGAANGSNASSGGNGQRGDDSARVRTTSDADFWREVQASLGAMVGTRDGRSVVMNIAAGVVVVKATPAELRQVEQYLKAVQLSIERQVMLEAKIVEVQLSKDSQTGINWAGFGKILGNTSAAIGMTAPGATLNGSGPISSGDGTTVGAGASLVSGALGRGFYGLAFQSANFSALLNFLQTQGDVQVLSSPRIATLNNQKAVLKVGSDELYVTGVSTTTTSNGTAGSVSTPSVTLQPFFSGIALDVTPQIDDAGNVMLHIHPSISTVAEKTKNVDLGSLGAFKLPLAASTVNETDSIVRVRDGQIVAIGGLMKQEIRDERTGLPVLQDAPVVGGMFRQTGTIVSKRELVIMLKPSVIQQDAAWPEATLSQAPAK